MLIVLAFRKKCQFRVKWICRNKFIIIIIVIIIIAITIIIIIMMMMMMMLNP